MIDKDLSKEIELLREQIGYLNKNIETDKDLNVEIELLKKQIDDLNKKIKELNTEKNKLEKLNATQVRIINKTVNHDLLRKYIKEDELISKIVEILEFCYFKVHRDTFKNFLKNEYKLEVDSMKDHELEAAAINFYRFQHVTTKTINKKLEELKCLKLIDFNDDNYYIKATDLLITIINETYKRTNNSIKDESELIMDTEDKLFAYRFTLESDYITENKELIDKFIVYNRIYIIDQNIFIVGRRSSEDKAALQRRIKKMFDSELLDKTTVREENGERTQIPIIIYVSEKMKFELKDIEWITEKVSNPIEIIRY